MPTSTFFNLPEDKREKLIEIAIAEFASHDYATASITQIVKEAKIAKGSLYQYFEDKQELYLYLVEIATQAKLTFLQQASQFELDMSFFPRLRWLFTVGTQFDLTHSALSQLVYRAIYGEVPFRDQVLQITQSLSLQYVQELVNQAIEQGDIAADINPELAAFTINTLATGLRHFIPAQLGLDVQQLAQQGPLNIDLKALDQIYDDLFRILEGGLGNQQNRPEARGFGSNNSIQLS